MRRPSLANSGAAPCCSQISATPATTASPSPTSSGTASDDWGARASRMPRPMAVNASWARNSAVTSTTVEAVASDQDTPCNVAARAPNTKPPTCENGRQLVDASRTMRPQTNTQGRRASRAGTIASQASPSTTNSASCQPTISAKSSHPTRWTPAITRPKPNQPISTVPSSRPARASTIESFFNVGDFRRLATLRLAQARGRRLYTKTAGPGYTPPFAREDSEPMATDGPTLLTGATGFVGSAVARVLAARGHRLRLLVRPTSDRRNLDGLDAELALGDLTDPASLTRAASGCRYVFNVAADYRFWVPDPAHDAARQCRRHAGGDARRTGGAGVERIVHCSSIAALGTTADGTPADEATPAIEANFIGTYKRSKFLRRARGAGSGAPRGTAGGGGQSRRARRPARHQADPDRQDDPRRRGRARAGLHRHRAQHRPCR